MRGMLIGAALTLLGTVFGFAFATKVDALAEAKWWDLLTAFGTVGAVVVALGMAVRTELSQQRRDRAVGMTVLRAISAECSQTKAFVHQALRNLQEAIDIENGGAVPGEWTHSLLMSKAGMRLELTKKLLPSLHLAGDPLRSDGAAKAVGLLHAFRVGVGKVAGFTPYIDAPTRETLRLLMLMGKELDHSLQAVVGESEGAISSPRSA